jgi:hypothetical protein
MNKQLQHIATALLLLVLLGAGKAWGQTYTSNVNAAGEILQWTNTSTWSGGVVPNVAQDNLSITVNGDMAAPSLTFTATNKPSLFRVVAGKTLRVNGGLIFNNGCNQFVVEGTIILEGSISFPSGSEVFIRNGGTLVVKGNATFGGNVKVHGTLLVSGNLSITSGEMLVSSDSGSVPFLAVGGNYTSSVKLEQSAGSITLLGNYTNTGSTNFTGGDRDILGVVSCGGCSGFQTVLETTIPYDPIFSTIEGIHGLFWEDFNGKTNTSNNDAFSCWNVPPGQPSDVSITVGTNRLNAVFPSARRNAIIWQSCEIYTSCYTSVTVSANVTSNVGGATSNAFLQYSIYDPATGQWSPFTIGNSIPVADAATGLRRNSTPISASRIILRLYVADLQNAAIYLDNISVSGTLTYGAPLKPILLQDEFGNTPVCEQELSTYKLTEDFYAYNWSVVGGTLQTAPNLPYARVLWGNTSTRSLTVEVWNECNRKGSHTWEVTDSDAFKVKLINKTDIKCASDPIPIGAIQVQASCGTDPAQYSYLWSDNVPIAQRTSPIVTGLFAGVYTVTATDVASTLTPKPTANLVVTITAPDEIHIELKNTSVITSCDSEFGCDGVLDFTIWGGSGLGQLVPTLNGPGTYVSNPTVRLDFTSEWAETGYQYKFTLQHVAGMRSDFSDIRFFSDPELTIALPYWIDPSKLSAGVSAEIYVRTNIAMGTNSIFMIYGTHSYDDYNSFTAVMDQGSMLLEYYENASWSGSPMSYCFDTNNYLNYSSGTTICTPTSGNIVNNTGKIESFRWSGWYTIPASGDNNFQLRLASYVESGASKLTNMLVFMDGTSITGVDQGGGNNKPGYKRFLIPSNFRGKTVFLEMWYTRTTIGATSDTDNRILGAQFGSDNGNWSTTLSNFIQPNKSYSRKSRFPEPSAPVFIQSAKFTGLCVGEYTLTVTDNGVTPTCAVQEKFKISLDADLPFWNDAYFPQDINFLITDDVVKPVPNQTILYESFSSVDENNYNNWVKDAQFTDFNKNLKYTFDGASTYGYLLLRVNTTGYSSVEFDLTVLQSTYNYGTGWDPADYFEVYYSENFNTNPSHTSWVRLLRDQEIWNAVNDLTGENYQAPGDGNGFGAIFKSGVLALAANNPNFGIQLRMKSTISGKNYFMQDLWVKGTIEKSVLPQDSWGTLGGYPAVFKADTLWARTQLYRDKLAIGCSGSYLLTRTWMAVDDCGTEIYRDQKISIARNYPQFDGTPETPDTDYSFCEQVELNIPLAKESVIIEGVPVSICFPYTIGYRLNGVNTILYTSNYPKPWPTKAIIPFVRQKSDNEFQWFLSDSIGTTTYSTLTTVNSHNETSASFVYYLGNNSVPVAPPAFCEGDDVRVVVTPDGGIGPYTYQFSTSPIHTPALTGNAPSGTTGTWNSDKFLPNDYVVVEIEDSRGCATSEREAPNASPITAPAPITVHEGITTNPIQPAP